VSNERPYLLGSVSSCQCTYGKDRSFLDLDKADLDSWTSNLLLFFTGCGAGVLNVVAGGGSFLTLPALIFLGLPPSVANGTNRVAILMQNIGAVWGFNRHGLVDWKSLVWAALPATIGAVLGVWIAVNVGDRAFQRILALLMIIMTLLSLWNPPKGRRSSFGTRDRERLLLSGAFFLIGIYGGFVQAGVGFLILATMSLAGMDLVRGNAIKVLSILCFTMVSLSIFITQSLVYWAPGVVLGLGAAAGGQLGVKLTVLKGHKWIRGVVTLAILLLALKLWIQS